jgi:hypothetical protein
MTYVCRMSCTRYYPGHALVREARRSASGRPRGCRESRVERRSASGADGAANGGCGGRRAAAASSTHRPLCGRTAGRPLPEHPSARRQRRRWRRAATATCGPRRGCSRALLLRTRKPSDGAIIDRRGADGCRRKGRAMWAVHAGGRATGTEGAHTGAKRAGNRPVMTDDSAAMTAGPHT